MILKGEIPENVSRLLVSGSPSCWISSCFTLTFYFHNKSLLNSLTIFLPLNYLSSRKKEHVPLEGNDITFLVYFSLRIYNLTCYIFYILLVCLILLKYPFLKGKKFCLLCSLLYPQHP
jgi:hypothetical protein